MKSKIRMIILSSIALTCISLADPASDQILIKMTVRSEKVVDGKLESRIVSTPVALTIIGKEAAFNIDSTLSPELPSQKEMKMPDNLSGYTIRALPGDNESSFLLKCAFRILNTPTIQSENGESISVQQSHEIKFSLKARENIPVEVFAPYTPNGGKLVFTFLTSRPTQEEIARRVSRFTNNKDYKKPNQSIEAIVTTPVE
jgi:hypothetical protein